MKILDKKDIHSYTNETRENYHSLLRLTELSILSQEYANLTIKDEVKNLIKQVIGDLNYKHHNNSNFNTIFNKIFTKDGVPQIIEGQEDTAVILHNNVGLIFKTAEPGVFLSIKCDKSNIEKSIPEIIDLLILIKAGFNNEKEFEAIMLKEELKDTLISEAKPNKKMKI